MKNHIKFSDIAEATDYPSLYSFMKIEDMSSNKYVKEVMDIRRNALSYFREGEDEIDPTYMKKMMPKNIRKNEIFRDSMTKETVMISSTFAIAGGFCRNHLLGTDYKTDIDLVSSGISMASESVLGLKFKQMKSTDDMGKKAFEILDNTLHNIPCGISLVKSKDGYSFQNSSQVYEINSGAKVVGNFVDSGMFDFTINCASISDTDGILYAPPATLYDIEHKIVRHVSQVGESFDISRLMSIPIIIRAIRFTLKYNMKMHNDLYRIIRLYFKIQRETEDADDNSLFYSIKNLYSDSEALREEIFSTLKKLGMYEVNQYSNLDEYFDYIKANRKKEPRRSYIITQSIGLNY